MNIKKLHSQRQKRRREKIYWFEKRKQIRLKLEKWKRCSKKEFSAAEKLPWHAQPSSAV